MSVIKPWRAHATCGFLGQWGTRPEAQEAIDRIHPRGFVALWHERTREKWVREPLGEWSCKEADPAPVPRMREGTI